jgi:hypothetical protein
MTEALAVDQHTRPLGYWESVCSTSAEVLDGDGTSVQILRVRGPLTAPMVRAALEAVQARQPLLRARLARSETGAERFVIAPDPTPPVPLRILDRTGDDEWKAVVEEIMAGPLAVTDGALWQATVLLGRGGDDALSDVLLATQHAISDGRSLIALTRELMVACEAIWRGETVDTTVQPLLRPVENLVPGSPSWPRFLAGRIARQARDLFRPRLWTVRYPHDRPLAECRTGMLFEPFSVDETTALVEACRRHGVTVNAALAATLTRAIAGMRRRLGDAGQQPFAIGYLVDLRARCEPPVSTQTLGCYNSLLRVRSQPDRGSFWELARTCHEELQRGLERQQLNPSRFDPKMLRKALSGTVKQAGTVGVISNRGRADIPTTYGPFEVQQMYALVSRKAGTIALAVHAVTIGGKLCLGFAYPGSLLEPGLMPATIADFLATLRTGVNSES